jgi:aspartate ammonia-lyase
MAAKKRKGNFRIEKDFLGEKKIPSDAYYGVQTQRAVENFPISGMRAYPVFVSAMAYVKKAAAMANEKAERLPKTKARAIVKAAEEVIAGRFDDQFVVDVYQAGAGTSFHMNMNEVLANRAEEILGGKKGRYQKVHPNDHVNLGQSTNDVFPTAMRIAALMLLDDLLPVLKNLQRALEAKSRQFKGIVKSGRTHLQDATPVTLGQEFGAYAEAVRRSREFIAESSRMLSELGIGGSAVGTGVMTHTGYGREVVRNLKTLTGLKKLRVSKNPFEAMQSNAPFSAVSSALKVLALELIRIANDLRLLSSGPRTGLGEIDLPAVQPGSSIMPGKVNPVICEMLNMVCFQVIGNDCAVASAVQAGQLELNVMMPVISRNLLHSMTILGNAVKVLTEKCVKGIKANRTTCRAYAEASVGMATLLRPMLGYRKAAELALESERTGKLVGELAVEKKLLTREAYNKLLRPGSLGPEK